MVTVAVEPVGTLPVSSGVGSLVLLSLGMPVALSLLGESWPLASALVVRLTVLLASRPSLLLLPAASWNLSDATLMLALVPVLAGVKVAVQTSGLVALCAKLLRVPPVTATSAAVKSLLASDSVKVTVAVSPATSVLALAVMAIVGGVVSMVNGVSGVLLLWPLVTTSSVGV